MTTENSEALMNPENAGNPMNTENNENLMTTENTVDESVTPTTPPEPSSPLPASLLPAGVAADTIVRRPPLQAFPRPPAEDLSIPRTHFRGVWPKREELALMPDALRDLHSFDDYGRTLGRIFPPHATAVHLFTAAYEWSLLRAELAAWQEHADTQESRAWVQLRALMKQLRVVLADVPTGHPATAQRIPGLLRLLGARGEIAKRAAETRGANREEVKAGRPAFKGEAGRKRERKAGREAVGRG